MAENLSSYTYSSVKRPRKKQCLQFLSEISLLSFDTDGPASENALSPNILTLEITISRRHSLTDETELSGTRRQFVTSWRLSTEQRQSIPIHKVERLYVCLWVSEWVLYVTGNLDSLKVYLHILCGPTKVKPTYIFVSKIWIKFEWIDKIQWFLVNALTVHSHTLGSIKN